MTDRQFFTLVLVLLVLAFVLLGYALLLVQ